MAQARLGGFSGIATANANMVDIFKANELETNPNSTLKFSNMVLRKIAISAPEGTVVEVNGVDMTLFEGRIELGLDIVNIYSLVFHDSVEVDIYYMY